MTQNLPLKTAKYFSILNPGLFIKLEVIFWLLTIPYLFHYMGFISFKSIPQFRIEENFGSHAALRKNKIFMSLFKSELHLNFRLVTITSANLFFKVGLHLYLGTTKVIWIARPNSWFWFNFPFLFRQFHFRNITSSALCIWFLLCSPS